jgi:hypothetical protein
VIGRHVEPPAAVAIRGHEPAAADDGKEHGAGSHSALDRLNEVIAGADGIEIPEDPVGAKFR